MYCFYPPWDFRSGPELSYHFLQPFDAVLGPRDAHLCIVPAKLCRKRPIYRRAGVGQLAVILNALRYAVHAPQPRAAAVRIRAQHRNGLLRRKIFGEEDLIRNSLL